jgi:hypothetical protein
MKSEWSHQAFDPKEISFSLVTFSLQLEGVYFVEFWGTRQDVLLESETVSQHRFLTNMCELTKSHGSVRDFCMERALLL